MTFANAMDVCDLVHICYHSKLRAHTQKHSRELCLFLFPMLQHRSFSKEWLLHAWEYHFVCIFCSCWCWFYSLSVLFHSLVRSLSLYYIVSTLCCSCFLSSHWQSWWLLLLLRCLFISCYTLYSFPNTHPKSSEKQTMQRETPSQSTGWLAEWMALANIISSSYTVLTTLSTSNA